MGLLVVLFFIVVVIPALIACQPAFWELKHQWEDDPAGKRDKPIDWPY